MCYPSYFVHLEEVCSNNLPLWQPRKSSDQGPMFREGLSGVDSLYWVLQFCGIQCCTPVLHNIWWLPHCVSVPSTCYGVCCAELLEGLCSRLSPDAKMGEPSVDAPVSDSTEWNGLRKKNIKQKPNPATIIIKQIETRNNRRINPYYLFVFLRKRNSRLICHGG